MANREIKFRAFVKKDKAMVSDVRIGNSLNDCLKSDSVVFMQYTGLKDANGLVCVYEGDIINKNGLVIGNTYESPSLHGVGANHTIARMGTAEWRGSESISMGRGCRYAEQQPNQSEIW